MNQQRFLAPVCFFRRALAGFVLCTLLGGVAVAGTTVINVVTEGSGDIAKTTGEQNLNGAMVWNSVEWVVNVTYAHKFFIDVRSGERLKSFAAHDTTVAGAPDTGTQDAACPVASGSFGTTGYGNFYAADGFAGYTISRQAYTYVKSGNGGSYCYGAVEYVIRDPATGREVVLRSRGTGNGTGIAYFDVYIDDDAAATQATAFRGDPVWFTYPGLTAQQAKLVTDTAANRTGSLPGAVTTLGSHVGDYYLDIGGGADLGPAGVGKSYELHTGPLPGALPGLSPAYVTGFEYKWMDDSGNLQKITVSPTLFKEVFLPNATAVAAEAIPLLPWPWLVLLGAGLAGVGALRLRNRH